MNIKVKKYVASLFLSIVLMMVLLYVYLAPYHDGVVGVGRTFFFVEKATTLLTWEKGLSERSEICAHCGMLFVFDAPHRATFWMKDMRFDIDILWVRDGRIVHIANNVSHTTPERRYAPEERADMVLEIPAGAAQASAMHVGDRVMLW